MIPDGWKVMKLGEFMEFKNGMNAEKSSYGSGVKFVNVMDVFEHDFLIENDVRGSMQASEKQRKDYSVITGDILFNRTSETFDEIALTVVYMDNNPIVFGGFVIRGRQTDKLLTPTYSGYCFQSADVRRESVRRGQGAIRTNIGQKDLAQVPILIPPINEQQSIAKILSIWDQAIETTEKLIANSEAQKKALMQHLLTGKKRLPGFEGKWVTVTLEELGNISSAGVDKKIFENETPVRLLNFLDAYHREFVFNSDLKHKVTAPTLKIEKCGVQKGDIFFTPSSETRNDIGLSVVASEDMQGVVYSYHVVRFRPRQNLDLNFSAFVFQSDDFKRQTYRMGDGSGQRYVISQANFRKMEIQVPSLEEQQAIGKILADCSKQISQLRCQLTALQKEKAAHIQQLLTGKRRVKIKEIAV